LIVTRYHNTASLKLVVEFLTPTFLGGADQNAELRAAPFKNLLRQWWRVAVGNRYATYQNLLKAEGELFGSVLNANPASASQVRIALTPTSDFKIMGDSFNFGQTHHPEVGSGGMNVQNALYLGYGPITYAKGNTNTKKYIAPQSKAELTLTLPKNQHGTIIPILQMIDAFGAIGSRCRNGWGAVALSGADFVRQQPNTFPTTPAASLIGGKEYPTALGADSTGILCWRSDSQKDWAAAMQLLATTYLKLRVGENITPPGLQQRHILGYPVTNHSVPNWGGTNGRMPSQLRLLVKKNQQDQLEARILHLPHRLPKPWNSRLGSELSIWRKIHQHLNSNRQWHRP
jgi:CRISPR-associated protein Cmr1